MKEITFRYKDAQSNWEWRTQTGTFSSVSECINFYGLGVDCDYEIISVKDLSA